MLALALLLGAAPAQAALRLQKVGTFATPIFVTSAPGDYSHLYVVERGGTVRVVRNGVSLSTPFADLSSVLDTTGERGLLSIAFPPVFQRSRLLYAYYMTSSGDLHVDELRAPTAERTDPSYRRVTIQISHSSSDHNGGTI